MGERRGTKGLELWCRKMTEGYPGVKIDNMTTSWRDGLAFCAIIHHFRPDLIEFSKLNKDDVYYNNELAFRVAERHLGIPALLEPEDMVEYPVPDRLSILTYLSQFYQAFAVPQGSSAPRIAAKRPQTSPDHGIVSPASTSPPSKVAFISTGKIRREPCARCGLPVFIAERLNVGKLLYHRMCFRCARCNSQLTLANYYETENGDYCCEICPDEDKSVSKISPEQSVLQRSLSDEEKTASLKTFSNEPDNYSTEFETALENILENSQKSFTLIREESAPKNVARSNFFQSQLKNSCDSGNEDEPPDLPKSEPPQLERSDSKRSEDTATSLKDSLTYSSANFDSGFPNNRFDSSVNMDSSGRSNVTKNVDASAELVNTQDIVTKDANEDDHTSVKARKQLFETNKIVFGLMKPSVKNSECLEKVPLNPIKSPIHHSFNYNKDKPPIPIVSLEDLENFSQLSRKDKIKNPLNDNVITNIPLDNNVKHIDDKDLHKYRKEKEGKEEETDTLISFPKSELESSILNTETKPMAKKEEKDSNKYIDSIDLKLDDNDESKTDRITISDSSADLSSEAIVIDDSIEETKPAVYSTSIITNNEKITEMKKNTFDNQIKPETENQIIKPVNKDSKKINKQKEQEEYPGDLNPFGDDGNEEEEKQTSVSLNPFEDDDEKDEDNCKKTLNLTKLSSQLRKKILPSISDKSVHGTPDHLSKIYIKRITLNPFESDDEDSIKTETKPSPLPAARKKKIVAPRISLDSFWNGNEEEETSVKLPVPKPRAFKSSITTPETKTNQTSKGLSLATKTNFGSNSSISSGSTYGSIRKKKPAPKPPVKSENFESTTSSLTSSPSHSLQQSPSPTPKYRKIKKAPPPPSASTPCVLRKGFEETNRLSLTLISPIKLNYSDSTSLENKKDDVQLENAVEQEKTVKDEFNRNRQSQGHNLQSPSSSENSLSLSIPNKSTYGKWKRRKGQAPTMPIPQKRSIKCLPMTEIRRELDLIETQQQGLEKQGVRLEQIIREKCEGSPETNNHDDLPIDVEDLILQLFELVNEKNELFRKQAELMYIRRQQRLEEEHADVEYQIRCLMLQPEANKTDTDKAREEELINRLVEIVERRNEIIECLEMDRVREAKEDDSISNHINLFTIKRDSDKRDTGNCKKDKKKKKEKKTKKDHKTDIDKDIDESEPATAEKKKKKKFNLF